MRLVVLTLRGHVPDRPQPHGRHAVLPADADNATLGRVVTMFRTPSRLGLGFGFGLGLANPPLALALALAPP